MRIIIAGAGDIGAELAENLIKQKKNELVIIDSDKERCDDISESVDALVLHGDASDPELLKKAEIENTDVVIAATGSDPINTVIAMLAKRMDVKQIIVKLNAIDLRSACEAIGVEKIITPKLAAVSQISSALNRQDEKLDLSSISSAGFLIKQFKTTKVKKKKISEIKLPKDAHILALFRDEKVTVPKGSLKENDELLIMMKNKSDDSKIRKRLEK